jgi:hypothetical protein
LKCAGSAGLTCGKQGSASFWKKKQKLLFIWARGGSTARLKEQKLFWFFFSKKELLAFTSPALRFRAETSAALR